MKACLDVQYGEKDALAACVLFSEWSDAAPKHEIVQRVENPEPYEPGAFYRRELPCLLVVLGLVHTKVPVFARELEVVLVDGYVWLDHEKTHKGIGAHLHEALGVPVIGIAKTAFKGSDFASKVVRGDSAKPLFVTSVGIDLQVAAQKVKELHGPFRLPTIVKRADRLARGD